MTAVWVDYSGGTIPGATLRAAGIVGCMRYVGIGSGPKRLSVAEAADLHAAGRVVLGIAESTTTRADAGYAAGVADAQAVLADPAAAGLPYVFATNDKPSFVQADVDYVRGFASVLGKRAGAYGFASFLQAVHAQTPVSLYWQAGEPPNMTGTQGLVHFWQRQGTSGNGSDGPATPTSITLGGVAVDPNNQLLEVPTMTDPVLTDASYQSLIWAVEAVVNDRPTILHGPNAGQPNLLHSDLAALDADVKAGIGQLAQAIAALPASGTPTDAQMAALQAALTKALPTYTVNIAPAPAAN